MTDNRLLDPCHISESLELASLMKTAKCRYRVYKNLKHQLKRVGIDSSCITSTEDGGRCWQWEKFPTSVWVGGFLFVCKDGISKLKVLKEQKFHRDGLYGYKQKLFGCGKFHGMSQGYKWVSDVSQLSDCITRTVWVDPNDPKCQFGCKTSDEKKKKSWWKFW